jgi:nucleotide-binding universal stress UspA family protein
MFQKIVVAYEGSGASEAALRRAAQLARVCHAELHLLGIVVTSGGLLLDPAHVPDELVAAERRLLLDRQEDTARVLAHAGISTRTCIRDGEPAVEIASYIKEIKADLAVIGHSRKGLLARWLNGSVGMQLLEDLPCSLLVADDYPEAMQAPCGLSLAANLTRR